MSNEMAPLVKLRELFLNLARQRGAKVASFGIDPVEPAELAVVLDLDEDLFLDDAQKSERDLLVALEKDFYDDKRTNQAVEAVGNLHDLSERLTDPDAGLLDDD